MKKKWETAKLKLKGFSRKITTKLFIAMLFLVLPVNLFAVILNSRGVKTMGEKINMSVSSVMKNHVTLLENKMSVGSYWLWYMKYNNTNGIAMMHQTDDEKYEYYKILFYYDFKKMLPLIDGMDRYFFFVKNREDLIVWREENKALSEEKAFIQKEKEEGTWEKGWSLKNINGRDILCLYAEMNDVVYGGWIYLDVIQKKLEQDIQYEKDFCTFTNKVGEERQGKIRITAQTKTGDIYMNAYLDEDEIFGRIRDANIYIQAGTIITLFLFPLLYGVIHHLLIVPLKSLNRALKHVETGDWDYRITESAHSSEYENSFQAFNLMAENIKILKIENYEKELEKEKMELKTLQLQIRPHFLLNAFNLLYTLAERQENSTIQEIILYLSDYFRHLFRSGKNLELFQREQYVIEGYIKLAKVSYPDSIDIEYNYDPEIMFVRVPPLLLHNFIENIVKHVVKKECVTHISIVGQYEEQHVTFMIMDDGPGISEERLRDLEAYMESGTEDASHIGFVNSLKRLKYFYGNEARLTITSAPQEGTCITLTFPYDLEEIK